jgi:6-pyruvoyltetrahydropterin/6-carboxytetrahydropterin synthase
MATLTRQHEFDTAHRVMHERVKCFNLHGHRFKVEVSFRYDEVKAIGYAVDFKEIKRVAFSWIDEYLDHGSMLNPNDTELIQVVKNNGWKLWLMGLGNQGDYNPSAENIAAELFYVMKKFFNYDEHGIELVNLRLYETPNCWVDLQSSTYVATKEVDAMIEEWKTKKGFMIYDERETSCKR